ncbi:MAG: GntR family transcriptional regulator [Oscillospiraceae bacterium]
MLFGNAQWLSSKRLPELLAQIEQITVPKESITPYIIIRQLQAIYGALGNDLLMRLVWQAFMFFLAPFLSVSGNLVLLHQNQNPLLHMVALCREKNWPALSACIDAFQEQKGIAFRRFYESRIQSTASDQQAAFTWSVYKKASQICYSLGMELLVAIGQGVYPSNSLLPSLNTLAKEKHVSVNTVRRTMALLNDIGATKSINGVGTKVLPPDQIAENCDLSQASVQKRLFSHAESVHILALSCRQVAEATIPSIDQETIKKWKAKLAAYARVERYELAPYAIINLISQDAPFMAVRTVYTELFRNLFLGIPSAKPSQRPTEVQRLLCPLFPILRGLSGAVRCGRLFRKAGGTDAART